MKKPPIQFRVARKLVDRLFKSALNIKVDGKENIPKTGPYILISNHLNWSDPFYYYTILPAQPRLMFVAEYDGIYDKWWNRTFINFMDKPIVPIHRDDPSSRVKTMKSMLTVIKQGHVLGIFPEGRIAHGEGKQFPFHVGAFSVARKLQVPILPAAIAGSHQLSYQKPVHIRFGEPLFCASEETDEDFARRMALVVKDLTPTYPGDGPHPDKMNWMTNLCQGALRPFDGEWDLIIRNRKDRNV